MLGVKRADGQFVLAGNILVNLYLSVGLSVALLFALVLLGLVLEDDNLLVLAVRNHLADATPAAAE